MSYEHSVVLVIATLVQLTGAEPSQRIAPPASFATGRAVMRVALSVPLLEWVAKLPVPVPVNVTSKTSPYVQIRLARRAASCCAAAKMSPRSAPETVSRVLPVCRSTSTSP